MSQGAVKHHRLGDVAERVLRRVEVSKVRDNHPLLFAASCCLKTVQDVLLTTPPA